MGDATLYDVDFYAWTQAQAAALREVARQRLNAPLDWENLAEEVDDLGRSVRRELRSRIAAVIEHLLKLEHSPALAPRYGWMGSITRQREEIERLLGDSPSLRREIEAMIAKEAASAARAAYRDLEGYGESAAAAGVRAAGAQYSREQVLGDWWPGCGGAMPSRGDHDG